MRRRRPRDRADRGDQLDLVAQMAQAERPECIRGRFVDNAGQPAEGAEFDFIGSNETEDFVGHINGTTEADGAICIDVQRSEAATEDLDTDGVKGEKSWAGIIAWYQDQPYNFGKTEIPSTEGSCATSGCLNLGDVKFDNAHEISCGSCTFSGIVKSGGQPLEGTSVVATVDYFSSSQADAACSATVDACTDYATTAVDGSYTLKVFTCGGLRTQSFYDVTASGKNTVRYAEQAFASCPSQAVQDDLISGYDYYDLTVSVSAQGVISWTPNFKADRLEVRDAADNVVWQIGSDSEAANSAGPINYGQVPNGWTVLIPDGTSPPALATGSIWVGGYGQVSAEISYSGSGWASY